MLNNRNCILKSSWYINVYRDYENGLLNLEIRCHRRKCGLVQTCVFEV